VQSVDAGKRRSAERRVANWVRAAHPVAQLVRRRQRSRRSGPAFDEPPFGAPAFPFARLRSSACDAVIVRPANAACRPCPMLRRRQALHGPVPKKISAVDYAFLSAGFLHDEYNPRRCDAIRPFASFSLSIRTR